MEQGVYDRAMGAWIGACCGDALGAPLEFKPPREPGKWLLEMTGGGGFAWRPGETTDDTDMALCVARMYVENHRYAQHGLVQEFMTWIGSHPKDVGCWTRGALRTWETAPKPPVDRPLGFRGDHHPIVRQWARSGRRDAGNGGVMRCIPSALATFRKETRMRETKYICEDSHPDPRCILSCLMVVEAAEILINGGTPQDAYEEALDIAQHYPLMMPTTERQELITALETAPELPWERWSNGGYTVPTVRVAFAAMLQAETFEEGLAGVVNRGGDADTVGAVAGSLLGARFGLIDIPERWRGLVFAERDRDLHAIGKELLIIRQGRP